MSDFMFLFRETYVFATRNVGFPFEKHRFPQWKT